MLFKNMQIYTVIDSPVRNLLDIEGTIDPIMGNLIQEPGSLEMSRSGWASLYDEGNVIKQFHDGSVMMCMEVREKIMPATVVNRELMKLVREMERDEGRPVHKREKMELKDRVINHMLPVAFVKASFFHVLFVQDKIIVNASSPGKGDAVCSLLRQTYGSLKAMPIVTAMPPSVTMTDWVLGNSSPPEHIELGIDCTFDDGRTGKVAYKGTELAAKDVEANSSRQVSLIDIKWKDAISCKMTDDLQFKSLDFSDELLEEAIDQEEPETAEQRFEADAIIMSDLLDAMIRDMADNFGGIA